MEAEDIIAAGDFYLGLATAGCSWARELWHFYFLFGILMPVGSALAGWPSSPGSHELVRQKARAGPGNRPDGGGLSFVYTIFVKYSILQVGWRLTFLVLAGMLVFVLFPLYLLFFYYRPRIKAQTLRLGRDSPGCRERKEKGRWKVPTARDWTLSQILRSSQLWLLFCLMPLLGGCRLPGLGPSGSIRRGCGLQQHVQRFHLRPLRVTLFLGQSSGFLSDRMGREKTGTLAASLSIIALVASPSSATIPNPGYCTLLHLFWPGGGLFTPTIYAGSADIFYGRHFGAVSGLLLTGMGVGAVFGPWLGGYVYDVAGTICPPLSCASPASPFLA